SRPRAAGAAVVAAAAQPRLQPVGGDRPAARGARAARALPVPAQPRHRRAIRLAVVGAPAQRARRLPLRASDCRRHRGSGGRRHDDRRDARRDRARAEAGRRRKGGELGRRAHLFRKRALECDRILMFDIVLVHPEIPPNAGNVIRLAANTGCRLHLVEPLGFSMDDGSLKSAGLDYHELAPVKTHKDWPACLSLLGARRRFAFTTKGTNLYTDVRYASDDVLVFGAETRGLP